MKASELIGKKAIRTKPVRLGLNTFDTDYNYDYSYTTDPLTIIKVTDDHILFEYPKDNIMSEIVANEKPHILDNRWLDDNWCDYDELIKLPDNK